MAGVAPVKQEFIVVSTPVAVEEGKKVESSSEEPPVKKAKTKTPRGQNTNRPRTERPANDVRLCPYVAKSQECPFKEKCVFMHEVKEFWDAKPADIGEICHLYKTFGKCQFGLSCRFAKSHTDPDSLTQLTSTQPTVESSEKLWCKTDKDELLKKLQRRKYDLTRVKEYQKQLKVDKSAGEEPNGVDIDQQSVDLTAQHGVDNNVRSAADLTEEQNGVDLATNHLGAVTDADVIRLRPAEQSRFDIRGKLYLAPLTTVGNLPFRRICRGFGAEVTCGEMALATSLLQGHKSEWALVQKHPVEKPFGVQLCGAHVDSMGSAAQLLVDNVQLDFIDINMGCPIDLVCQKGGGCMLMRRTKLVGEIIGGMQYCMGANAVPITVKMRTGIYDGKNIAHFLIPELARRKVPVYTIHGRSKEQRYTKVPQWDYVKMCAQVGKQHGIDSFACGDVLSYKDYYQRLEEANLDGIVIARGALMKPWIFTEIKERRDWDISSGERLEILRNFVNFGLEHWGSDQMGVDKTRRFLLEWLAFLHRYIPVGLLERLPQRINERPPVYRGRDELETLMASPNCSDWVKISELLLGPVPDGFVFLPKHKANSY